MILSDNETKVDLLNNETIATTIIKLLRDRPDRPVTIGVHGDWGAGKSSVLEMIEAGLDGQDEVLCLKFNGWRFQGFEDAKIALLEGIVTGLVEKRPALSKATAKVKAVFRRIDWLKIAKKAGGLALTAFTGIPTLDQVQTVITMLEGVFADPAKIATKENVEATIESVKSLLKPDTENKNVPEEIGEFRKAFDDLLKEAKVDQLVVLVDDLDRCLPDTAIETLEAIRLFVFNSRTAFVVAADEAMIEYAVRKHFPDLPDTTGSQTYARNYLEKLIQVPFRIPALGETETRIYVTLLLIGAELKEEDTDFIKLIDAAREHLKRPWVGGALAAATVNSALGDKASRAKNALMLSDQIGPILASGTKGNPRQIKRFLNTLVLRQRTADARGFGEEVKLPVLAKLMLAERFLPRLFDQVASVAASASDGICTELTQLETAETAKDATAKPGETKLSSRAKAAGDDKDIPKPTVNTPTESAQLSEWLSSQAILAWAAVQPSLSRVDLRPYLFVAKDRKDYFGATSILGHLATIVEQLLGPKILVQALEDALRRLAPPEAAQVFEMLRGRIVSNGTFDKEPPGIPGLTILVKAQPTLQSDLLSFLESLPREKLGPWAISGWGEAIKDSDIISRFDQLLRDWSASTTTSPLLKAAVNNTLRMRPGSR
jgi:predicted KAP-like P-loop ATPase